MCLPVHPHACGENAAGDNSGNRWDGTPPRVWGKLQAAQPVLIAPSVHPHACGENCRRSSLLAQMRRYTPTRVGKTTYCYSPPVAPSRYTPTRVGKTSASLISCTRSTGTPPRVWGKLIWLSACYKIFRGTPPRVWGKRAAAAMRATSAAVHPHACGENVSSPLRNSNRSVHPHACGENADRRLLFRRAGRYTPTRVGKTLLFCSPLLPAVRYTPTRVGKTHRHRRPGDILDGTPPRVWGKRA